MSSSCASSTIDDPEKHFLGDLLADADDVFTPSTPHRDTSGSSTLSAASAPASPSAVGGAGAGNAAGPLNYWPEPPPPYSAAPPWVQVPPAAASGDALFGGSDFLHPTLKDQPEWSDYATFLNATQQSNPYAAAVAAQPLLKPIIVPPTQVHHHHPTISLHHHHYVSNHHHFNSAPPQVVAVPPPVSQAPIGSGPRPLSYRDVANRQCGGTRGELSGGGPRTSSSSSLGNSSGGSAAGTPNTGTAPTTPAVRSDLVLPNFSSGDTHTNRMNMEETLKRKTTASNASHENEFQRITRKKGGNVKGSDGKGITVAANGSNSHGGQNNGAGKKGGKAPRLVAAPVAPQVEEVDAHSRFDILQKLAPTTPSKGQHHQVKNTVQAAPISKSTLRDSSSRSRSSSQSREGDETETGGAGSGSGGGRTLRRVIAGAAGTGATTKAQQKRRDENRHRRGQRSRRAENNIVLQYLLMFASVVYSYVREAALFCWHLVADIATQLCALGVYSLHAMFSNVTVAAQRLWNSTIESLSNALLSIRQFDWRHLWRRKRNEGEHGEWGLEENIALPNTGEEAMERLLRCRGQDAYVVLGLRADCSDDAIKRHYKRQAVLVHPDKNTSQGADEAFKVLSKAFEMIGTPEARLKYNLANLHKNPLHKEMEELWEQLRQKMEEARETMACDCGRRHRRLLVEDLRPAEARFCRRCNTRHSAKHNEIWAETHFLGFCWVYYACIDGAVYDITQWATCERNQLKHMKANAHAVQYRLVSSSNLPPPTPSTPQPGSFSSSIRRSSRDASFDDFVPLHHGNFAGSSQVSFRPPERRIDDERPRRAGRRKKLR